MSTELCKCSELFQPGDDLTLAHHPGCERFATVPVSEYPIVVKGAVSVPIGKFSVTVPLNPATAQSRGAGGLCEPGASPVRVVGFDCRITALNEHAIRLDTGVEINFERVSEWLGGVSGLVGVKRFGDYYVLLRKDGAVIPYHSPSGLFDAPCASLDDAEILIRFEQRGLLPERQGCCSCGFHQTQNHCDEVSRAVEMLAALPEPPRYNTRIFPDRWYAIPDPNRDEVLISGDTLFRFHQVERQRDQLAGQAPRYEKHIAALEAENAKLKEQVRELEGRIANALL